jgi:hypothetical protein
MLENVAVSHTGAVPNLYLPGSRPRHRSCCLTAKLSIESELREQLGLSYIHHALDQRRILWKSRGELSSKQA